MTNGETGTRIPVQEIGLQPPGSRIFVGRAQEMAEILEACRDARGGAGALFWISGDAGIGKTWLAEEAARAAGADGFQVLWGRCRERAVPVYWPWIEAMRSVARTPQNHTGQAAARLADRMAAAPGEADEPFWLMDAVAAVLREESQACPVLLLLEDLHWADGPSLALLEFLAPELAGSPIVALGSYRDVEVRLDPGLREVFGHLGRRGRSLPLRGLDRAEVEEVATRRFGLSLAPEALDALCRLTEGNPWFIDELARLARSEPGAIGPRPARTGPGPVPDTVRACLLRRVEPLADSCQEVLSIAALMRGEGVALRALAALVGVSEAELLEQLDEPIRRGLVQPDQLYDGLVTLSPPLLGAALCCEMVPSRRAKLLTHAPWLPPPAQEAAAAVPATVDPRGDSGGRVPEAPNDWCGAESCSFRKEGEYWTIMFCGRTVRLRDAKGLCYLAQLLSRPQIEVHAMDFSLIAAEAAGRPGSQAARHAGLTVSRLGDAGAAMDARAKAAYRQRIDVLREGLREAREFDDAERAAQIEEEIDAITRELSASFGLHGRDRKAASVAERTRVNVTRTLRSAIEKIGQAHPALGRHLEVSVKTGTYCSYRPDPGLRLAWRL